MRVNRERNISGDRCHFHREHALRDKFARAGTYDTNAGTNTYTVVLTTIGAAMVGLFSIRHDLLTADFGTNYPLLGLGVLSLILSGRMRFAIQKHLSIKTLLGFPEISPNRFPRELITEGIYARMRHPRYVQLLIALIGYALIANYLATYLAVALWIPGIYIIVQLEEKELRAHFGESYDEYCRKVPRFLTKLRGDSRPID